MVDKVFKTILLFTPIAYCVGVHYYKFELVFFQLASILLFASALFDTPKREFNIKKLMVLFLGICLFSVVINGFQDKSLSVLITAFIACVDIFILAVYSKDLRKSFNWLMIGLGINTLVYAGQMFGYSPFIDPKTLAGPGGEVVNQYGGIIGNAPRFAAFIALALPFVSRFYLIPALILGIFLKETSIFVAISIVVIYKYGIYDKEWGIAWINKFFIIVGIVLIAIFSKSILQSFSLRITIWEEAINHFAQRPLVGFGLGNFKIADYSMSSFLQWIYGVGLLGVGFICLCLKRIKWYLIPLLFLCLFEYPFEIPRLYPLLIAVIAYYAIEQKEDKLC